VVAAVYGSDALDYFKIYLLAENLPQTKIIFLSSTIDPEDFSRAKKFPIVAQFVSKQLSVENLAELKENEFVQQFF
jgi:DNA-binding NarL/FixJ family response regulator